jgi:hypothetical protein
MCAHALSLNDERTEGKIAGLGIVLRSISGIDSANLFL